MRITGLFRIIPNKLLNFFSSDNRSELDRLLMSPQKQSLGSWRMATRHQCTAGGPIQFTLRVLQCAFELSNVNSNVKGKRIGPPGNCPALPYTLYLFPPNKILNRKM